METTYFDVDVVHFTIVCEFKKNSIVWKLDLRLVTVEPVDLSGIPGLRRTVLYGNTWRSSLHQLNKN